MKLILNGGGSDKQIINSLQVFANIVKKRKVMYIPLAWNNGSLKNCIEWFKSQVNPFGISDIVTILDSKEITIEKLNNCAGVFIGGGNTYKLLKLLKDTNAYNNLKVFMQKDDSVVMGGSAGALIFGNSIDTCLDDGLGIKSISDHNDVKLENTDGFNLIRGYSLLVHYKKKEDQIPLTNKRIDRLLNEGYKLICIPEETSIFINDNNFSVLGSKPAEIITKDKRIIYYPKDSFYL